jgi:hypothetical protein
MVQPSLKICACRPAQGAVPLLKSKFVVESEHGIRGRGYERRGNTHKNVVLNAREGTE